MRGGSEVVGILLLCPLLINLDHGADNIPAPLGSILIAEIFKLHLEIQLVYGGQDEVCTFFVFEVCEGIAS